MVYPFRNDYDYYYGHNDDTTRGTKKQESPGHPKSHIKQIIQDVMKNQTPTGQFLNVGMLFNMFFLYFVGTFACLLLV